MKHAKGFKLELFEKTIHLHPQKFTKEMREAHPEDENEMVALDKGLYFLYPVVRRPSKYQKGKR